MKIAIVGSRSLSVENIGDYIPQNTTEIISGGAKGVDACAKKYAIENNIKLTEFILEYQRYRKSAPLKRNMTIAQNADIVIAFWDGSSKGTKQIIEYATKIGVTVKTILHIPSQ